jgi:hypothetical protein
MFDTQTGAILPPALSHEIARAREWLATLPPVERQACELIVAARVMTWAQDLERISLEFGGGA